MKYNLLNVYRAYFSIRATSLMTKGNARITGASQQFSMFLPMMYSSMVGVAVVALHDTHKTVLYLM